MMHQDLQTVTGGVDTHGEQHVASAADPLGRSLGTASFPATAAGYRQLLSWMRSFGDVVRIGVEGTGSYGAGLSRFLTREGIEVVEIDRPNRQARRRRGKSDATDSIAAARAAQSGEATGTPKSGDGPVEAIRALRIARRSAIKARTQAANQIRDLIVTAPDDLRAKLHPLGTEQRVEACARFRREPRIDPAEATKRALRFLARRHQQLGAEVAELDVMIGHLCIAVNPALMSVRGVGPDVASILLVAAGDNPRRMRSEASFAALCGVSPVEASSGKVVRHRLNQGGNREANHALWRIVMVRLSCDERTQRYVSRRRADGRSDREIIRCLKRYVAREIYHVLTDPPEVPNGADLRRSRVAAGITLATAAAALGSWPIRITELERSLKHDADLARRYLKWLESQAA